MSVRALSFVSLALAASALGAVPTAARIDEITLQRTSCYGTCPVYKLTVRRDGNVTYDGKDFVKVKGHRSRTILPERFQKLAREAEKIGFFSFDDDYSFKKNPDGSAEFVTDMPTTITTVSAGKMRKTVKNYYGGPKALERFEKLIDKLTESVVWIGE